MALSGVAFEERDVSFITPIRPGGRICVAGPCSKGPFGTFTDIDSSEDFRRVYGGSYVSSNFPDYCIANLDGGAKLRVSRVAHATDPNDLATLTAVKATQTLVDATNTVAQPAILTSSINGPWVIDDGTTFTLDIDGAAEATKTVSVDPASVTSGNDETQPWDFTGGLTLEVKVNQGPTQVLSLPASAFAIVTAATALEVAAAINSAGLLGAYAERSGAGPNWTVDLKSDRKGTGAYIQVVGGTANAAGVLNFSTTEQQGSGDFPDHENVTPAQLATYLQGANHGVTYNNSSTSTAVSFTTVATGSAVHIGFDVPSSGAAIIGLTEGAGGDVTGSDAGVAQNTLRVDAINEGEWANGLDFTIAAGTSDPTNKFNLVIEVQIGQVERRELYEDLSMVPGDARYAPTYVNARSKVVRLTDLNSPTAAPDNNPAAGAFSLASGDDGLTGLVGNDFVGGATSKLGMYAFDGGIDAMDLLTPTIHEDSASGVPAAQISIKDYVENRRDMVYHLSPPDPNDPADSLAYRNGTAPYAHQKFDSSYLSLLFGEGELNFSTGKKTMNAQAQYGAVLSFNDTGNGKQFEGVGPWYAPAGEKRGGTKFQSADPKISINDKTLRQSLEDAQINYLLDIGTGILVWNQATLQVATSAFSDLNVRRLMIFTEQSIVKAILSETFEPNDPVFFRAVFRKIDAFLDRLKGLRAFYDYGIFCDQDVDAIEDVQINTPEGIDEGIFVCKVFLKPTRAAKQLQLIFTVTSTGVDFETVLES